MANEGMNYIREAWDALVHGKKNKKSSADAQNEINNFIAGYTDSKLPVKEELPASPVYERVEVGTRDEEAERAQAERELAAYKREGERKIEQEIDATEQGYRAEIDAAGKAHAESERKIEEAYESARRDTNDDMLKRGLARSSIAANKAAALGEQAAAKKSDVAATYAAEVKALEAEIAGLGARRAEALGDFNLAYVARLDERIRDIAAERDKKIEAAIKYNNGLTEKEHAAAVDKKMKESDLYSEALEQTEKKKKLETLTDKDRQAIYAKACEQLRAINAHDAADIVRSDPNLRDAVGNILYYRLYDEFCR